jgi:hypothetical protein
MLRVILLSEKGLCHAELALEWYRLIWDYYYRYSALGLVRAKTRAQSDDWYGSGTLHPGQILRGSLPLLSPDMGYVRIKQHIICFLILFKKVSKAHPCPIKQGDKSNLQ